MLRGETAAADFLDRQNWRRQDWRRQDWRRQDWRRQDWRRQDSGGPGKLPFPRPLAAAALYSLGRWEEAAALYETAAFSSPGAGILDSWDRLLPLMARLRAAPAHEPGQAAAGLRDFLFEAGPGGALAWAAEEIRLGLPDFLSGPEKAALEGRLATAGSSFGAGLARFRAALEDQPELFQRYPALVTDLGRCFQFTASGNEGIELFLAWERQAPSGALRYRLLYFAGRIARARGNYTRSRELFTQALAFAPDGAQEDVCVWYIMDTALMEQAADPLSLISTWMPRWHDPAYFDDILDRIASGLAASGEWRRFPEASRLLEAGAGPLSRAKYAYISGRALSAGLIPADGGPGPEEAARPYFRAAYEAGTGPLYYRALSAYFLKEPFPGLEEPPAGGKAPRPTELPHPQELEFLRGFFDAGIGGLGSRWVETLRGELSTGELRLLAETMEAAGAYAEQIRLVSAYMGREDYELQRRDLELLSPRPFRELVEEEARRAEFSPALLYGLIRTESAFQAEIVSRAGAVGLTQLMPATAMDMAGRMARRGEADYRGDMAAGLRDPAINIRIGAFYLAYLRDLLERPLLSILAYNGGMSRVRRWYGASRSLPGDLFLETVAFSETREYGRKVLSAAAIYGYLYYDMKMDAFLADMCK